MGVMWEIQNALALPPQQFHFQAIVVVMMMTSDVNWDDFGRTGTRSQQALSTRVLARFSDITQMIQSRVELFHIINDLIRWSLDQKLL